MFRDISQYLWQSQERAPQLSPRREALTTGRASQGKRKGGSVLKRDRETAGTPAIPDLSWGGGQDEGETHKLRRNCKNPAVAERGLRGECGSDGGSVGETRREEKQCERKTVLTRTAHCGPCRRCPHPPSRGRMACPES